MALFKDTEDFATVFPLLESTEWEHMLPFVELQEISVIRDQVLGLKLYNDLHNAYQASIAPSPTPMTPPLSTLLPHVRKPLAFLSSYEAAPTLNVQHNAGGMTVTESTNVKAAHMWRYREARSGMIKQAHGFLDLLINFLITYESDYPSWAEAPVRAEVRESFIPSMTVARRYVKLAGPWLLHHLRPAMRSVQVGEILNLLGQTAYDALLEAIRTNTTDAAQNAQLELIRPAILHTALAESVVTMALTVDNDGVWTWQSVTSGSTVSGGQQPANKDRVNSLVLHHKQLGQGFMERFRQLVQPSQPSQVMDRGTDNSVHFGA